MNIGEPLDRAAMAALAEDELDGAGPIALSTNLSPEMLAGSVVATRGMRMLAYASEGEGIGLTKSGALNRKFLAWAVEAFRWPGYETDEVYAINKVVDEIDYLPGWYLHEVMKRTKMMRKHRDRLIVSPAGREALDRPGLWRVRQSASSWASARALFEAAVLPDDAVHELADRYPDAPIHGFQLRILRMLGWFGMLECDTGGQRRFDADAYRYRATPLFDRFVHFDFSRGGDATAH